MGRKPKGGRGNPVLLWPKLFFGYVFTGREVQKGFGCGPRGQAFKGDGYGYPHHTYGCPYYESNIEAEDRGPFCYGGRDSDY